MAAMFGDIAQLGTLLEKSQLAEDARLETDGIVQGVAKGETIVHTASQIAAKAARDEAAKKAAEKAAVDPKDIWAASEVVGEGEVAAPEPDDGRAAPEYDILYKQSVNSGDVYLGISGKTPGSHDCEVMVVKIKFPGEQFKDLDLDVQRQHLVAMSSQYKLNLFLPYPVDHKEGKARFEAKKEMLIIDLPIIREDGYFR